MCVKRVYNVFTHEHFNLGNHQSERCLVGKNVDICHVPGTVLGFLCISSHLIFRTDRETAHYYIFFFTNDKTEVQLRSLLYTVNTEEQ